MGQADVRFRDSSTGTGKGRRTAAIGSERRQAPTRHAALTQVRSMPFLQDAAISQNGSYRDSYGGRR